MGQYYKVVNLDKRQFLNPHTFGSGLKLMEFGSDSCGPLLGLAILLADGNGRGGGDLRSEDPIVGSWNGNRIVIAGDYADGPVFPSLVTEEEAARVAKECFSEGYQEAERVNVYSLCGEGSSSGFEDISQKVIDVIVAAEGPDHPLAPLATGGERGETDGWRQRQPWGGPNGDEAFEQKVISWAREWRRKVSKDDLGDRMVVAIGKLIELIGN